MKEIEICHKINDSLESLVEFGNIVPIHWYENRFDETKNHCPLNDLLLGISVELWYSPDPHILKGQTRKYVKTPFERHYDNLCAVNIPLSIMNTIQAIHKHHLSHTNFANAIELYVNLARASKGLFEIAQRLQKSSQHIKEDQRIRLTKDIGFMMLRSTYPEYVYLTHKGIILHYFHSTNFDKRTYQRREKEYLAKSGIFTNPSDYKLNSKKGMEYLDVFHTLREEFNVWNEFFGEGTNFEEKIPQAKRLLTAVTQYLEKSK